MGDKRGVRLERCVLLTLLVVFVVHSAVPQRTLDLYEGASCRLRSGASGTCKRFSECASAKALISRRQHVTICSYIQKESVVCCENVKNTTRPIHAGNANPFIGSRIVAGDKARKVCNDLSNEVRARLTPLIHNGVGVTEGEFPHMAVLGYRVPGSSSVSWHCGGSLISDRYVITAAHCITGRVGKPIRVRLGEHDLSRDNDHAVDYGVARVTLHPQYKVTSWYHDVALIELDRQVVFNNFIHPACLSTSSEVPKRNLIITGWGSTTDDGRTESKILQRGIRNLVLIQQSDCAASFKGVGDRLRDGLQAGQFCAQDPKKLVDTCSGDSGGPIQEASAVRGSIIYTVVGVTSGGSRICNGASPAIYTSVSHYMDWIEKIVWP